MKILVVDHSKVFRALWNQKVLRLGHEPITVANGTEGLEVLRKRRIDLVCVSLSLPDMDGVQFCRELRQQKQLEKLPVILVTSTDDKKVRKRAFEAGVTEIHGKTDVEDLFQRASKFAEEHDHKLSGRVLYVEDSSVVAHVMLKILRGMDLEVEHFTSAADAFDTFREADFDLIISDILVEGDMSGMGLVSEIRELESEKARVPVLAVSGMDDSARRIELFRLGVNDFITKPVVKEEVEARVTNLIVNKQLIDQVQSQQHHLYELAMTDQLTGLYNRNSLPEFASKYFSEANRHDFDLSVMIVDVDHFKEVNDTYGHMAGDTVLSSLGEMLKTNCRNEDFAVRFGGEEFLLIMPHCTPQGARKRADQLRAEVEALNPENISITASIGVTSRQRGKTAEMEELFKAADHAVYEAKENGRNRVATRKIETESPA